MKKSILILLLFLSMPLFAKTQLVFVSGYRSEKIKDYYDYNIKVSKELGFKHITRITPEAEITVAKNARMIARKLSRLEGELIVIGHSKGGVEILNAFFGQVDLIERTKGIFIIQSPVMGSPYADYFWEKSDQQYGWNPAYWTYSRYTYAGSLSLRTPDILEEREKLLMALSKHEEELVSKKVFFVTSKSENLPAAYDEFQEGLQGHGPNDGLVPTRVMSMKNFGTTLTLPGDFHHLETVSLGEGPVELRKAKIFTTMKLVFGSL